MKTDLPLFRKIFPGILIILVIGIFLIIGPEKYFNLQFVQDKLAHIKDYRDAHFALTAVLYLSLFVVMISLCLPVTAIFTVTSGAIFGFWMGSLIASAATLIGAILAFLMSRYFFHDLVQEKYGNRLHKVQSNFQKDGALYLFTMRMVPLFPYALINLLMGLTPIKLLSYAFVTWIGMIPIVMILVNAGTQLSQIESIKGIISPQIMASLVMIALFPYLAKLLIKFIKKNNSHHAKT